MCLGIITVMSMVMVEVQTGRHQLEGRAIIIATVLMTPGNPLAYVDLVQCIHV